MLKILLAGDAGVGKTSIVQRFIKNNFVVDHKSTVGVDVFKKRIEDFKDKSIVLSIWDIAGQDRYNFMRNSFYQGTDGIFLMFDVTRQETFKNTQKWLTEIREALGEKIPFLLIGNKIDLLPDVGEVINRNEPMEFAEKHGSLYKETSAKTGLNVEEVFYDLINRIIESKTYSVDMYEKLWEKQFSKKKIKKL